MQNGIVASSGVSFPPFKLPSTGTAVFTVDASGNVTISGSLTVAGNPTSLDNGLILTDGTGRMYIPTLQVGYGGIVNQGAIVSDADSFATDGDGNVVLCGTLPQSSVASLTYRAGTQAVASLSATQAVVFTTPLSSANYAVSLTFSGNLGVGTNSAYVTNKTAAGFTINLTAAISGGINVDYLAIINA